MSLARRFRRERHVVAQSGGVYKPCIRPREKD